MIDPLAFEKRARQAIDAGGTVIKITSVVEPYLPNPVDLFRAECQRFIDESKAS